MMINAPQVLSCIPGTCGVQCKYLGTSCECIQEHESLGTSCECIPAARAASTASDACTASTDDA